MSRTDPTPELNADFSEPGADAPPWSAVLEVLVGSEIFWLSTTRGDGRPHVTPIPAVWDEGALHICTGAHEQKAANLAREPRCVLTTGSSDLRGGLDVVVEGTAVRVTDPDRLGTLAARWKAELDWDFTVGEHGFHDGAGRDGLVYAVAPSKVLAFGKGPYTQTRFRFPA